MQLRATIRWAAEQRGVRVVKWLGDGAMLSGIDRSAVISCAMDVRDRVAEGGRLRLRGGVCSGPVIMLEGDDYTGDAVNWASLVCDSARAGEVLIVEPESAGAARWTATAGAEGLRPPGPPTRLIVAQRRRAAP